jgi:hypothetical protein
VGLLKDEDVTTIEDNENWTLQGTVLQEEKEHEQLTFRNKNDWKVPI